MADANCCLDQIKFKEFSINSPSSKASFMFDVFGGSLGIKVFNEGVSKPVFYRSLNPQLTVAVENILGRIQKASPETRMTIIPQKWDRDAKTWSNDYVMIISKDKNNVYHIGVEYKDQSGAQVYDFVLKGAGGINFGSEQMSEADRSGMHMQTLVKWLDKFCPLMLVLSARRWTGDKNKPSQKPSGGGNDGGGESYYGN